MVELRARVNPGGLLYVPKEIRECFGTEVKILTDATAALFFPEHTDYEDVLTSLDILRQDLQHRRSLREKQVIRTGTTHTRKTPKPKPKSLERAP